MKKDEHQLEEELEQELRIKKYREEMKALWLKRNRIQEAVQLHKAIRIYKRKLMNKVFIRWSAIISTRKEQAIKKKGDRERLLRLCFEAFRIQRTIASPIVPRFQSQFRILNHCMEQWKLFCTLQNYYREMQLKYDTARFIHDTRLKYRAFRAINRSRISARFARKRLHFSGWQDYFYNNSTQKQNNSKIILFKAWKDIVNVTKKNKLILNNSLSEWRVVMVIERKRKNILNQMLIRRTLHNYVSKWYHLAIYTPKEKCNYFQKKKFFKRWNVYVTAMEIKRQHSILALFRDRAMSPIVASPAISRTPIVKKYGRKPTVPKVRVKPRNSPSALFERKMNVVYV